MRMISILGAFLLIAVSASAQSDAELIAEATSPLPSRLRDGATVTVSDSEGTQRVIRQGTNVYVCRPDNPEESGFSAGCSDKRVQPAMAEYSKLKQEGLPEDEILAKVAAGVRAGTVPAIPAGAMQYVLSGPDERQAKLLVVMRLPEATAESTGLPTEPSEDHAWLMFAGTHQAHVMMGSTPYGYAPNR